VSGEKKDDINVVTKMASGDVYVFPISIAEIEEYIAYMKKLFHTNVAPNYAAVQVNSSYIKNAAVRPGQKGMDFADDPVPFIGTLNPMLVEAMYVEV
jgi:hypothetical protein